MFEKRECLFKLTFSLLEVPILLKALVLGIRQLFLPYVCWRGEIFLAFINLFIKGHQFL